MKQLRVLIGAACLLMPVTFAAAQTSASQAMASPTWTVDTYLDQLGHQMAIKPAQQPAWKKYTDTMAGVGTPLQHDHKTTMEAMGTASWQERCNMVDQMLSTHKEAAGTAHKAAAELWPVLDAAQKQKAKAIMPGLVLPPAAGFG